ncbi:ubiquitin-conjugating enzyme-like protein, partial [Dinothrombium tinctorium]
SFSSLFNYRDIRELFLDPIPGVFVATEESDFTEVHALITGPADTPYAYGFFYFLLRFPSDYPVSPPRVKFMTTCNGTVRFNPNLYKNGKVCLSILGTWEGPSWTPANTLSSVLLSIQSLMCDAPYHNEPGFEKVKGKFDPKDVANYSEIIQHETIRVAVCDMVDCCNADTRTLPASLKNIIKENFIKYYSNYEKIVKEKLEYTPEGTPMRDPFSEKRGKFFYQTLLTRLQALHEKYSNSAIPKQKLQLPIFPEK